MKNPLLSLLMPILPKNDLSHFVGKLVHKRLPGPFGPASVKAFADYYKIDLDEAELPLESYRSIGELFTRKLKPGIRPIGNGIVHPADSRISECGLIDGMKCIQAKDKDYSLPELLRGQERARIFDGGTFVTYYLCPTDYHRVHCPMDARVSWVTHVPGEMWPVNEWSVNAVANLFSINERVIVGLESAQGRAALVMVAATNVGNMTISFDESIRTNVRGSERAMKERSYDPPRAIRKGDEVGIFHMGSTVVMLYEKGLVPPSEIERLRGARVRMGESLLTH